MNNKIMFSNITVVTLNEKNDILFNSYICVSDGKIIYVGSEKPLGTEDYRIIDGKNKVVMPGLINAHTHIPMTVLRNYSDDKNLEKWLYEDIFPIEDKFTDDTIKIASEIGVMESLSFGTTSIGDMYFYSDEITKVCANSGIKANISRGASLFTEEFDPNTHKAMVEQKELFDKWNEYDNGLIKIDCSIHGEYTSNYKLWEYVASLAERWDTRIQIHLSETQREHEECIKKYDLTPTEVFLKYGVFDNKVVAAHCVYLTDEDMDIIKSKQASVILNSISNLKLASGVADGKKMFDKGIKLSLGTDSAASNNNTDLFEEIKLTAILQKERAKDTKCFNATDVLKMATQGGATAQGREDETGVISNGMDADIIMLDFDKPHLYPCHNVISNIVYSAKGSDVCMTMVRGKILYENGEFMTIDKEKSIYELNKILIPKLFS